ncbi:hypothetical protein KVR01_010387 [Diaporthe batatas]|uniref:uncharacterized protein n=1 Tax=Diaporthe batatas TaxID=748121 RepID=UPI001D0467A7|nr:uncharacterized protein KVR01_010387 [Diaporthe batatas]KAG8159750.1 hypothetical protein KVR01_010387 [Diaporthe batatas]
MAQNSDTYIFTRDYLDNTRINLQHYLWVESFGYLVHPKIPLDRNSLRIADVGTGTGIWLTSLGAKLPPSVQLDGLDVSFHAAPPSTCLPANVRFQHWDIKQPPPSEIVGVYDVVHLRNFLFVLGQDDLPGVTANISKLLKPGGYVQWGEPDMASWRIAKTKPDCKTAALEKLFRQTQAQDKRLESPWVSHLAGHLGEAGFDAIESDVRDIPLHLELATQECNLLLPEQVMRKSGKAQEGSEKMALLRELLQEVAAETREGAFWAFTRHTVIGRKPE